MQAYPDEIGKMNFKHRRDAFCGKFSVTDVFEHYKVPYTVMKSHVVDPLTPEFKKNLYDFAAVCRVVKGMRRFTIGCIGARTTAFKTVRFDEVAMQRHGINVESFDLRYYLNLGIDGFRVDLACSIVHRQRFNAGFVFECS